MKREVKAIIFDMNGVLALGIELKHRSKLANSFHAKISKKLEVSLDTWFDAIDSVYGDSIEGKISEKKTLNTIAKNLKIPAKKLEKEIISTYKHFFKHNKKLYNYAFKLKSRGYKIAVLSDQWHLSKKAVYDKKLLGKFDAVITSSDAGIRKPNQKIYKLTLRKLGVKASESIFVDNRDWNTKPAEKLGMKTVLFKNNKQAIMEIERMLKKTK